MSDIYERAKKLADETAHGTSMVIRLDFFQALIAEIERLQVAAGYRENSLKARKEDEL